MVIISNFNRIFACIPNLMFKGYQAGTNSDSDMTTQNSHAIKKEELDIDDIQSDHPKIITWRGIVMFAVSVQLGNHFTNWTGGLGAGFWPFVGIIFAILTAFGCEMLCIAEMTSALPFSGGTYGVVRVTLGDFQGYLLGTCEALQYILYVAFTTTAMAKYITAMTEYEEKYEPLYWLIMYSTITVLLTFRRTLFWKSMWVFGIYILVMILLYCTMTREKANFDRYVKDPSVDNLSDNDHAYNFFRNLPSGGWLFNLASKIMPLTCSETENPTMNVPKAMYIGYCLTILSVVAVVFSTVSIYPGVAVLKLTRTPLMFGFSEIFDITPLQALSFTLIAKFATCLPYAFAYSVLISSLSKSGFMGRSSHLHFCTSSHSYLAGIFSGSIVGFILNLVIWFWDKEFLIYLSRGYALLGFGVNLTIFVTYIVFKSKFSTLIKTYKSPVGIYGAIYGLIVFGIVFVSMGALGDPDDRWLIFVLLAGFLLVWSAPYFLYYRHNLTYSEEESTIMFIAYVIKANQARRTHIALLQKQRSSQSVSSPHRNHHHCPRSSSRSSQSGSEKTKPTYVPAPGAEEGVDIDTTSHAIQLYTRNDGIETVADSLKTTQCVALPTDTGTTKDSAATMTLTTGNSKEEELSTEHALYYPPKQSSSNNNNINTMSTIPESRKPSALHIELPTMPSTHSASARDGRIHPFSTAAADRPPASDKTTSEQGKTHGVSALDTILTRNLRYGSEAMGIIRTELQEFYEAGCDVQQDEEV